MLNQTAHQISDVFREVLENMAFMFADNAATDDTPETLDACLEASISYRGPSSGTLTLLTTPDIALELASNLLGTDPDDSDSAEEAADALGELMNVTLGRLLTELAGEEAVFDLTPPQVDHADAQRWAQFRSNSTVVAMMVDDQPVLLELTTAD